MSMTKTSLNLSRRQELTADIQEFLEGVLITYSRCYEYRDLRVRFDQIP